MRKSLSIIICIMFSLLTLSSCLNKTNVVVNNSPTDNKSIISTDNAPKAIGPYSQAVVYNKTVYCSGQIAIDPETNKLIDGDIEVQTRQIFENIKAVLEASNSSLDNALKVNVFLTDMDDFNKVNEIYEEYFKEGNYPARSAVEISKLPKDAKIEIELTAYQNR